MTTAAVMMVKDEADIIVATISHLLTQVDRVFVADNGSTDGTRDLLEGHGRLDWRVSRGSDPEVGYYQSRKMSALAAKAARHGFDWVLPVDADEIWYSPFGRIGDVLEEIDSGYAIATATLYDHVATAEDPVAGTPVERIGWRRTYPAPLHKVAVRPSVPVTIEQGNHGAHYGTAAIDGLLVIRHFPYRSAEQMWRKAQNGAAAYAETDLPEHEGAHWKSYSALGEDGVGDAFRRWFWVAHPRDDDRLIFDPAPCG